MNENDVNGDDVFLYSCTNVKTKHQKKKVKGTRQLVELLARNNFAAAKISRKVEKIH